MGVFIRTNGRGNAWPIQLGLDHPFYKKTYEDIANVSFSVIKSNSDKITNSSIEWELLIDAGHGAIQHLITNENRIPEALVLTHAHHDHTFGIDWLIQSYCRQNNMKPYPLYATKRAWDFTKQSYPHLEELVEFKELIYGKKIKIDKVDVELTPIPVYHGESAVGACMLVLECEESKAIFSGDVLCPLIRKIDYPLLNNAKYFFTDTNNRFPYPKSNHWSITTEPRVSANENYLDQWLEKVKISHLIAPTIPIKYNEDIHQYFDSYFDEQFHSRNLILSIFDFVKGLNPENVMMVHYSGAEDVNYHGDRQLNDLELAEWANKQAEKIGLHSKFFAPKVGDVQTLK